MIHKITTSRFKAQSLTESYILRCLKFWQLMFYISQVELCKECIQWATEEKRQFLRQALEARLIALYHDKENIHFILKTKYDKNYFCKKKKKINMF